MHRFPDSLSRVLTSRRGAWLSLALGLLALVALIGAFGRADLAAGGDAMPPRSESAQVASLADEFPDADEQSLLVVASRDDGGVLTPADLEAIAALVPVIDAGSGASSRGPVPSEDGEAAVIQATVEPGDAEDAVEHAVDSLRATIAGQPIDGISVQVTGGAAFGVDVAAAFDGADFTLLLVTIGIVALLLILTYRSPVLWLVPLVVVALADQLASKATAALGTALELQFDTGIVSVLVFGAGTNYALLLVSRYREQLLQDDDHRTALARAWRASLPAIVASNATVVVSLLTLLLAVVPGTRGLGVASAVGLLIALAAVLLVLPPALAVCGRGVFWPFVPRPGAPLQRVGAWRALGARVVARPVLPVVAGVVMLAVAAAGLIGTQLGLTQAERFRVPSESALGLEVLGDHFVAGEAEPMVVIAEAADEDAVTSAIDDVPGVERVTLVAESDDSSLVKLLVVGDAEPGSPESLQLVRDVRDAAHDATGSALVGGPAGAAVDARDANVRDFLTIAPLVLLVTLAVLLVLLRAVVAPLVLLLVNALSATAAIGAGAWLGRVLFGWTALDLQVPLLAFLFLVALGVDYTIFLVHRARSEAAEVGTRPGMVNAVAATGGVITSAGLVLAGVFAALGLLPLVTLGQLGLIVGVGVLMDTLVVRTLVVPALFSLIGDRMWWPGRLAASHDRGDRGPEEGVPGDAAVLREPVG
ncbi:MMPL family transporter [Microbacterium sp. NEAU-LLC]|uniref:MMPL family transporter n=1 Tax=Microbacterium helvum TaxID=2773713 RepID=A0ABR8NS26_9MICO|nr:MMPL family transporter [Microbacterium helvum]MBD3943247.1 MMPL family transporter [Microbacterium helvum]